MSYNNYVDADAAWRAAFDLAEPAVAIIKHANPCGIAVGADVAEAHRRAHACDPVSAFGGVIAANRPVTAEMAEQVAEIFTEVIVAPGLRGRGARGPHGQEEHPGAASRPPAARRRRRDPADLRRPAAAGADRVDAAGDDPATWTLAGGEPADDDDAAPTSPSPGGRAAP